MAFGTMSMHLISEVGEGFEVLPDGTEPLCEFFIVFKFPCKFRVHYANRVIGIVRHNLTYGFLFCAPQHERFQSLFLFHVVVACTEYVLDSFEGAKNILPVFDG